MKYTKYLVTTALALSVLTGCGSSDSDDKKEAGLSGTKVNVTEENAKAVSESTFAFTELSLFLGMEVSEDDYGPIRSMQKLVSPNFANAAVSEYPIVQDCANEEGSATFNYQSTENSEVYTVIYDNCEDGPTLSDGSMTWTYSYSEAKGEYTKKLEADKYVYEAFSDKTTVDLTAEIVSNVEFFGNGMQLVDGVYDFNVDGTIVGESNEYNSTLEWGDFQIDLNTSGEGDGTLSINGSFAVSASMNEEEVIIPPAPKLGIAEPEVNCTELLGVYNIQTLEELQLDEGLSGGKVKINGAIFAYNGSDMNVTIDETTSENMEQGYRTPCLFNVLPPFIMNYLE